MYNVLQGTKRKGIPTSHERKVVLGVVLQSLAILLLTLTDRITF